MHRTKQSPFVNNFRNVCEALDKHLVFSTVYEINIESERAHVCMQNEYRKKVLCANYIIYDAIAKKIFQELN